MDVEYHDNCWSRLPEDCVQSIVEYAIISLQSVQLRQYLEYAPYPLKTRLAIALLSHRTLSKFTAVLAQNDFSKQYFDTVIRDWSAPTTLSSQKLWIYSLPLRLAAMSTPFYEQIAKRLPFLTKQEAVYTNFVYRPVGRCDMRMLTRDYNSVKSVLKSIKNCRKYFQKHDLLAYYMAMQQYCADSVAVGELSATQDYRNASPSQQFVYLRERPAGSGDEPPVIFESNEHKHTSFDLTRCIGLKDALANGVPARSQLIRITGLPKNRLPAEYWRERVEKMQLCRQPLLLLQKHGETLKKAAKALERKAKKRERKETKKMSKKAKSTRK